MEMNPYEEFGGKRVHIIGCGRSGMAAADILVCLGAKVTMHDNKDAWQIEDALTKVRKMGLEAKTGPQAYEGIGNADLVIVSPGVAAKCPGIVAAQERGVPTISEIELAYRVSPAPIIGVTGTNGKSTTSALIAGIFLAEGKKAYLAGNILAGEIRLPLARAAFRSTASEVLVGEISSFQLEWIRSFKPKVAMLLNISTDHLDRYGNMEDYIAAKMRIFEYQDADDAAVLNADDPVVMELSSQVKSKIWLFSRKHEVELGTFARGSEVWAMTPSGEQYICDTSTMKLRGLHNQENVLAATAAVLAFGGTLANVQEAVNTFQPLAHRLEPVGEINGVEFLNNSMCTNMQAAIRSMEAIGKSLIVIAGGKGKGDSYTPLAEAFRKYAKHVVLMGEDAAIIAEAADKVGYNRISHALSMEESVETAWRHAKPGDTIMLSPGGSSFDMFVNFEQRGDAFRETVGILAAKYGAR
jgi:UDP-N-acetylmuramoylalanine--D-glutamate ligase